MGDGSVSIAATGDMRVVGNNVFLGSRKVGVLARDFGGTKTWYVSHRERSKHYFIIWKGWGVALEIVEYLERAAVHGVKLIIDGKTVERTTLSNFRRHGHVEQYNVFEPQLIMAEKYWLSDGQTTL